MKATKFALAALVAGLVLATGVNATSIGRSGGGHSSSVSVSRPSAPSHSAPAPSKAPSVAPAPAKPGGIGGTQGSVGVRKSEVTQPVAQQVRPATTPAPSSTGAGAPSAPVYSTSPTYSAPAPQPSVSGSSVFWNSLGGSFAGNVLGNMLFNNHGHSGGTTVINNGGSGVPNSGAVAAGPGMSSADAQFNPGVLPVQPKKEYTMWSFIGDAITFVILIAVLVGIVWVFYKGFQLVRGYINKERGVSNIPFNPTQKFWEIQKAFSAADVKALNNLLGPDLVDELTNGLQASTLNLHNVSHEVRLANATEFSIWYKFEDDGAEVNQVWHYEKFGGGIWKLNGIENV